MVLGSPITLAIRSLLLARVGTKEGRSPISFEFFSTSKQMKKAKSLHVAVIAALARNQTDNSMTVTAMIEVYYFEH